MEKIRLGRTNLMVSRSGFGAIPIQRLNAEEAGKLLKKAYAQGINFYDTARGYTDSEEKIGLALSSVRKDIIIATKSPSKDKAGLMKDIATSLSKLQTDHVDILQFHNPDFVPRPGGADGLYDGIKELQAQGKVRFIGFTNHRLKVALEAVQSDLYDTIQFPLNCLSSDADLALIAEAERHDVGVIAMKALSGGLITNVPPTFAFLRQYANVVPIWGIQYEHELDEFLALEEHPPVLDEQMWRSIQQERNELSAEFCRGCGYCLPCPVDIPINMAARMSLLMKRMPYQRFLADDWRQKMERIAACIDCGACKSRCPYGLDTPALLKHQLVEYREFYAQHV